jgi:hypothetical protein
MPQWLKDLLKNKKVMGMIAAAILAGIAMLTGVPKEQLKEAICDVAPAVAAPVDSKAAALIGPAPEAAKPVAK